MFMKKSDVASHRADFVPVKYSVTTGGSQGYVLLWKDLGRVNRGFETTYRYIGSFRDRTEATRFAEKILATYHNHTPKELAELAHEHFTRGLVGKKFKRIAL